MGVVLGFSGSGCYAARMASTLRTLIKTAGRWLLRIFCVPLAFGIYWLALQSNGNFHAVVPGEFYRSAQPDAAMIAKITSEHGIRSIVNLRGENATTPWYIEEIAASKQAGAEHLDFRMSSKRELTPQQAQELIAMLRAAPKPVWIHCHSGADRAGLVSALYLAAVKHEDPAVASRQLSLRYGHVSAFGFNNTAAMDRTFEAVAPQLIQHNRVPTTH